MGALTFNDDFIHDHENDQKEFDSSWFLDEIDETIEVYCPYCRDENPGCSWCHEIFSY